MNGRRTALNYGNGAVPSDDHDALGRLNQLVHSLSATANDHADTPAFNPAGQAVSRTRSNATYSYASHINADTLFGHNDLNQMTSATASTAPIYVWRSTSDGAASPSWT